MPSIIDAVKSAFATLVDDEPILPLNILEASNTWYYYAMVMESISFETAELNTTIDEELTDLLHRALKMCTSQSKQLEQFMIKEGIPFPPVSETKPDSDPQAIPPGVKLTNDEIANGLAMKVIALSAQTNTAAAQAVRTDVGVMWVQFLTETLTYGMTLKTIMRKRGWAKIPPAYTPPGIIQPK